MKNLIPNTPEINKSSSWTVRKRKSFLNAIERHGMTQNFPAIISEMQNNGYSTTLIEVRERFRLLDHASRYLKSINQDPGNQKPKEACEIDEDELKREEENAHQACREEELLAIKINSKKAKQEIENAFINFAALQRLCVQFCDDPEAKCTNLAYLELLKIIKDWLRRRIRDVAIVHEDACELNGVSLGKRACGVDVIESVLLIEENDRKRFKGNYFT